MKIPALKLFLVEALRKALLETIPFRRFAKEDLERGMIDGLGVLGLDWSQMDGRERAYCLLAAEQALAEVP